MGGNRYFISPAKKSSWKTEVQELGFVVEDLSDQMTESDKKTFVFIGKLKNGKTERFIQIETFESGYVLAVRFAGKNDSDFLKKTLGTRFPNHRFEKQQ